MYKIGSFDFISFIWLHQFPTIGVRSFIVKTLPVLECQGYIRMFSSRTNLSRRTQRKCRNGDLFFIWLKESKVE